MSPKNIKPSSTAVVTADNWVTTTYVRLHSGPGKTSVLSDPNAMVLSGKSLVGKEGKVEIRLSMEPVAASRRMAIRKLNEELEGRFSPTDTYASKTAG